MFSFCLRVSELGHRSSALGLELLPLAFLVLRPLTLDRNYAISLPGSPTYCQQIGVLFSLHNHVSHFLIINLYIGINNNNMYI